MLALSALGFAAPGALFLFAPARGAALVGIELAGATAQNDVRAVYGGLQLACAALLLGGALRPAWLRAGLALQLATFAGLAGARGLSLALDGAPSALGFALHGAELAGLAAGAAAWRGLAGAPTAR